MKSEIQILGLKFEVRLVIEEAAKDGRNYASVIYSCNGTRLQCYEHDQADMAMSDYNTICNALRDVKTCLGINEILGGAKADAIEKQVDDLHVKVAEAEDEASALRAKMGQIEAICFEGTAGALRAKLAKIRELIDNGG